MESVGDVTQNVNLAVFIIKILVQKNHEGILMLRPLSSKNP